MASGPESSSDPSKRENPPSSILDSATRVPDVKGRPTTESDTMSGPAEVLQRLQFREEDAGRYELRSRVARGGMGVILSVWDPVLRRSLAMKVISDRTGIEAPASQIDDKRLGRFLEEAQVTGQLDHPGIVPVHELGVGQNGGVYFTMRLVRGRNLQQIFDLLHEGKEGWNRTRALGVILRVCEAMAYAHSKKVIHRDLKPANIMVGRFGEVYTMDWGVARVLDREDLHDLRLREGPPSSGDTAVRTDRADQASRSEDHHLFTMDGDIVGTPAYMSPEQAKGKIDAIDARSDIYSVGAMLYHLLTGAGPYWSVGPSQNMVLLQLLEGPPTPIHQLRSDVPTEVAAICEKAMAREPRDRYASMEDLGDDLRAYLERRVVKAYETGAIAEIRKWIVRNKGMAAVSAAAIVLLIVGLATSSTLYVRSSRNERLAETRRIAAAQSAEEAKASAELALERQLEAEAEKLKVLRLSDVKRLELLEGEAESLWPAFPSHIELYRNWLVRARELTGRMEEHREALAGFRLVATPAFARTAGNDQGAQASDAVWILPSAEEQWQHDVLSELVTNLETFIEPGSGLLVDVESRLAFAETVAARTQTGPEAAAAWREAIESIAAMDVYRGLAITPQLGLLPIGQDLRTGLWEFAHVQTGELPARNAEGMLLMSEESCLVFVLIPPGRFLMGAQAQRPDDWNYDPLAEESESPTHEVELDAFFLSKYEMTQGQWLRAAGVNPSNYTAEVFLGDTQHDLRNPVEQVSWEDCRRTLSHMDLTLPTEAQWEYAARAGTQTPWWPGDVRDSLIGVANLADQAGARAGAKWPAILEWPELEDGFPAHAPVGAFPANPFGLHEVHGNVFEWCLDRVGDYSDEAAPGSGLRSSSNAYRVYRGGSFLRSASSARTSYRDYNTEDYTGSSLGVRPARSIQD